VTATSVAGRHRARHRPIEQERDERKDREGIVRRTGDTTASKRSLYPLNTEES
jgi:hypothetical protein